MVDGTTEFSGVGSGERIRRALPEEAEALSALAFRSKAHWGYSDAFMRACRGELTISPDDIETHPTFVAEARGEAIGFYTLERVSDDEVELGYLFVEPSAIGRGHGRRLLEHAKQQAVGLGFRSLVIQGDPNAERFYRMAGGEQTGSRESASLPGRELPMFRIDLCGAEEAP
jgi:GNAT superfamily N-acetyltransferase